MKTDTLRFRDLLQKDIRLTERLNGIADHS